jgi:hypothetical protein
VFESFRLFGGVELSAVEFDDEVLGAVDGVDFVAGYVLIQLGEQEVVALEEPDETVLGCRPVPA